ncbi:MAG: DUF4124 domain-containing protein [Betaproteobacteria bacterium]|nr:DUF4124 domain-containing protein [Betaproteobacteria bacterium]
MKPTYAAISSSLLFLGLCLVPFPASTQVFKCIDTTGKVTYSNGPGLVKGCKQLSNEQTVSTISMRPNPTQATFPRISDEAQKERDKARRYVLEKELDSERSGLEDARNKLTEQEVIFQDGEAFTNQKTGVRGVNHQKKLDRLQPYKDAVDRRERNIEALTRELSELR